MALTSSPQPRDTDKRPSVPAAQAAKALSFSPTCSRALVLRTPASSHARPPRVPRGSRPGFEVNVGLLSPVSRSSSSHHSSPSHPSFRAPDRHVRRSIIPRRWLVVSKTFVIHPSAAVSLSAQWIWPPLISVADNLIPFSIDFTFKKVTCAVGMAAVLVNHSNRMDVKANIRLAKPIKIYWNGVTLPFHTGWTCQSSIRK